MNTIEKIDTYLNEAAKSISMDFECMECGKKFKKKVKNATGDIRCPGCRGVDVEPQE
jgi:predicted Zn-ribbon and HTH transcriptional regulator